MCLKDDKSKSPARLKIIGPDIWELVDEEYMRATLLPRIDFDLLLVYFLK